MRSLSEAITFGNSPGKISTKSGLLWAICCSKLLSERESSINPRCTAARPICFARLMSAPRVLMIPSAPVAFWIASTAISLLERPSMRSI